MYFLIDYENTTRDGLNGANLLRKGDILIFFHNKTQTKIALKDDCLEHIINNCEINHYILKKQGKNGLDFYIATKVGELMNFIKDDPTINIAIISRDKGYEAIRDYCRLAYGKDIIIASDICNAYNYLEKENASMCEYNLDTKQFSFNQIISKRQNKEILLNKIEENEVLCDIVKIEVNEEDLELVEIHKNKDFPMKEYPMLLHKYGKKEGHRIYGLLKEYELTKRENNKN